MPINNKYSSKIKFVSLLQPIIIQNHDKINMYSAKNETNLEKEINMPKPISLNGNKNLIGRHLIELRNQHGLSQRALAQKLQLAGYDIDKNVITRIETNKRYVTDIEIKALASIFDVSYAYLIDGTK